MARNRRTLIKGIVGSSALGSIASVSGAKPGNRSDEPGNPSLPFVVQDGRVDLLLTRRGEELNAQELNNQVETHSPVGENPEEQLRESIIASLREGESITGEDAAYLLARAVERLNDVIDEGYLEITNESGPAELETTQQLEQEIETVQNSTGGAGTSSFVETIYNLDGLGWTDPYYNHYFYTDDDATEEIKYRLEQETVTAAFLGALCGASGVGAPLTIAAAILTFISGMMVVEYNHENNGCGCVTEIKHLPASPGVPVPGLTFDYSVWSQ